MQELLQSLKDNISKKFIGRDETIHNIVVALLAGGHVFKKLRVHFADVL